MNLADYYIKIGNATDIGNVRIQNEDYLAHFDTPLGYCIIICDGMGGHTGGQVAAQTAIAAIQEYLQDAQNGASDISDTLKNSFEFANFQLKELIKEEPSLNGMGTTCVLALIKEGGFYTAHAGDSRIYLIRENEIKQITKDHSSVQQLIDNGVLSKEEAKNNINKNQIVKAIGAFDKVSPTVLEEPIQLHKDDRLLLCSDGLTDNVSDAIIAKTIRLNSDVQTSSVELIKLANKNGGTDNITVQLIHYLGNSMQDL